MSFLDNYKSAGVALFVVGALQMIVGVIDIITGITDSNYNLSYAVLTGIGCIICGFIYFGLGMNIYKGVITDKFSIVTRYVLAVSVAVIVGGICAILDNNGAVTGTTISSLVIDIVIGLVIYWVYTRMVTGNGDTIDKALWVILVIVFALCFLGGIFTFIAGFIDPLSVVAIITGICHVILYLFVLVAMFDDEVKYKMGM